MKSLWEILDDQPHDPTDELSPNAHFDTVIIGAGLTGLTTALLLTRAGKRVAVIEARSIAAVTTGKSTAKLSLLHSGALADIHEHASAEVLRAYVEGNREGQQWLLRYLEDQGVEAQRRDAFSYATTDEGVDEIRREFRACTEAGLATELVSSTELPFAIKAGIKLENQAQFDPMQVTRTLASDIRERGGLIVEGVRVKGVTPGQPCSIHLGEQSISANQVVLATGIPILDRGFYFAKLQPSRSYVTAFRIPPEQHIPQGMYVSLDTEGHSLRTADVRGEQLLLIGGGGHIVGREQSAQAQIDDLVAWSTDTFAGADPLYYWSAQDYMPAGRVPFVGQLPRGEGKVFLATGFNKWGMTNTVSAALSLTSDMLGGNMEWARILRDRSTTARDIASGIAFNTEVAKHLTSGWVDAELRALPDQELGEGEGAVGRVHGKPVAVSKVEGRVCQFSAICPHLGGIVSWNDAEKSWDCPLHGSRFGADGTLLEGPAVDDLTAVQ